MGVSKRERLYLQGIRDIFVEEVVSELSLEGGV